MKNTSRVAALGLLSFFLALGGCGGGGSDGSGGGDPISQKQATSAQPKSDRIASPVPGLSSPTLVPGAMPTAKPIYLHGRLVRGLDNFKGSCFINAALQVIAHDEVLRKRVLNAHAAPEIHTFFSHYDQPHVDLAPAHADLVTHLRKAGNMPPGGGFTEAALNLLGAGYTPIWMQETGAIVTHLGAGEPYFNLSAVTNQLNRRFDRLPENARIKHFIHYTGGHYLSYFRDGERWIEANDANVKEVDMAKIAGLPNQPVGAAYMGIAFVGYQ